MTTPAEMNMQTPAYAEYEEHEQVNCNPGFFGET
jgi:hypothetical protein